MDEAMAERVRTLVSDAIEGEKTNVVGGTFMFFGVIYVVKQLDAEKCKRFIDHYAWHALEPRAPRANKAKYAEKVEERLDQVRFWETAAAMLKAAKVKTLGELLHD